MTRSDAQSSKAPLLLPPKPSAEFHGVEAARRRFATRDAPQLLSVEELVELRRNLDE